MRTQCDGPDIDQIRSRLGLALEAAGLSPNAASERAKVARASVGFILNGKVKNPSVNVIGAVSKVLNVSLDWLVWGVGNGPSRSQEEAAA